MRYDATYFAFGFGIQAGMVAPASPSATFPRSLLVMFTLFSSTLVEPKILSGRDYPLPLPERAKVKTRATTRTTPLTKSCV